MSISCELEKLGIEINESEVQFIQKINGATIVRLKDGSIITVPSRDHKLNLGERIIYDLMAERLNRDPRFDPRQPMGLDKDPRLDPQKPMGLSPIC